MSDRVTIQHVRRAGWCMSGVRPYCQRVGIDFRRLVREGIPISEVEGVDDHMIQTAVEIAKKDKSNG